MGNTHSHTPQLRADPRNYVYARDGSMIHRENFRATQIIEEHRDLAAREAQIAQQTGRPPRPLAPAVQWSLAGLQRHPSVHRGGEAMYENIHPNRPIARCSRHWSSPFSLGLPRWGGYDEVDRPRGTRAGGGPYGGSRHGSSQLGGSRHGGDHSGGSRYDGSHSRGSRYGGHLSTSS